MAEERVQRRLTAILAVDVVGYSRLMRQDEAGTLAQLKRLRSEILDPKATEYGGRVFNTAGDGVLVEFPSAVDAVQCAVDVQQAMRARNADVSEDQTIEFRIGINVGDVIVDGNDLYGDGVNVAARLEGLADPGGVCISGTVYESVRNKLDVNLADRGEQPVKNIAEPVRIYKVAFESVDGFGVKPSSIQSILQRLRSFFRPQGKRPPFRVRIRRFLLSLAVAAAIEVVLIAMHGVGILKTAEDIGADLFMTLYSGVLLKKESARPFAFLDIDDETHWAWGEPLLTPRDNVTKLIQFAAEGGAALIVVDIDLSSRTDRVTRQRAPRKAPLALGDQQLADYLAGYGEQRPPIILQREFSVAHRDPRSQLLRIRTSFLDRIVARAPNVHWAAALFEPSPDMVIRRWRLWEAGCRDDASVEAMPSVQLLAFVLLEEKNDGLTRLQKKLNALRPDDCTDEVSPDPKAAIQVGDRMIDLSPTDLERRVLFSVPWQSPVRATRRSPALVPLDGVAVPLIDTLSARRIIDADSKKPVSAELLRGRIVVIGGSNSAARDFHATPVGRMPGSIILINAIHTVRQHGALRAPSGVLSFGLVAAQVLLLASLFYLFNYHKATFIALILVSIMTFGLSTVLLKSGIWIDAAMASCGVVLHRWIAIWERRLHGFGNKLRSWIGRLWPKILLVALIGVLFTPWLSAEASDRRALVGKVESVSGPTSGYQIHRAGVTKSVEIYSPILAGDRIVVLNQDGVIRIVLSNGRRLTIDRRRSPYSVAKIGGAPTPFSNLVGEVGRLLTTLWDRSQSVPPINVRMRAEPKPTIPMLAHRTVRIAAGPRRFALAWRGGELPHAVQLFRVDGQRSVLKVVGLKGRKLSPRNLRLPAGRYRVEVEDADFRRATAELEAVEKNLLPKAPDAANLSHLTPAVRTTVEATWLAGRDNGAWAFEAYLKVASIANEHQPARILRDALARGWIPTMR